MLDLLIRYLRFSKLRKSIEEPFDSKVILGDAQKYVFNPPIMQQERHLSLVKIYVLAWMNAYNRKSISMRDLKQMDSLKTLGEIDQVKELKSLLWKQPGKPEDRTLTADQILFDLPHRDRFNIPTKGGVNPSWRDRLLTKAKKIHRKYFTTMRLDMQLVHPRRQGVMSFEISHLDALRCESAMCVNFEVYRKQNQIQEWPKTSDPDLFMKFGWIVFWIRWDGTIYINEIQAPVEMMNQTSSGELHHFIEPPNWSGFMLQQFLQYFVLRGFTRFTIPTVEKRKSHLVEGAKTVEMNYRELPRSFGFKKEDNGWWWLDFNR